MPRLARKDLLYDGCYVHVISRSIRQLKLFKDDQDFDHLYNLLRLTQRQSGSTIHHYCLMHTHFHLVVQISNLDQFAGAMRYAKSQYSYHFHERYQMSGPIWRERYRALLIENEAYLRSCGVYIEHNPVKAGMVTDAQSWPYSSYRHYHSDFVDPLIGTDSTSSTRTPLSEPIDNPERFFERGRAIGSAFFRWQLNEKFKPR